MPVESKKRKRAVEPVARDERKPQAKRFRTPLPPDGEKEKKGPILATVETTKDIIMYGVKGSRLPHRLTTRLCVRQVLPTSCRLALEASYHVRGELTNHETIEVAWVSGFLVDDQGRWKEELLLYDPDYSKYDTRNECARLFQTLYGRDGSKLLAQVTDDLGLKGQHIVHVDVVYVFKVHQDKGLMGPVLKAFRELLQCDGLREKGYAHEGIVLLAPGKFDDYKAECWKDKPDVTVARLLSEMYARCDSYNMVIHRGMGSGRLTTLMGRMASDDLQVKVDTKRQAREADIALVKRAGLGAASNGHTIFAWEDKTGVTRSRPARGSYVEV